MFKERLRDLCTVVEWNIGYVDQNAEQLIATKNLEPIHWLKRHDPTRFLADPFPLRGTRYVLCEEAPIQEGAGRIVAVAEQDGNVASIKPVLDESFHHSYPIVSTINGVTYVVPEDIRRGQTTVYEISSDLKLTFVSKIIENRRLADVTVLEHAGRLWIFCTDIDIGYNNNLCIFFGDSINGPFTEHPASPVKLSLDGSRCGGAFIHVNDRLYRPAQNCKKSYGSSLSIFEVTQLSTTGYREELFMTIGPDRHSWFKDGLHTLSEDGNGRIWVDGKRQLFSWQRIASKIRGKVSRIFA